MLILFGISQITLVVIPVPKANFQKNEVYMASQPWSGMLWGAVPSGAALLYVRNRKGMLLLRALYS